MNMPQVIELEVRKGHVLRQTRVNAMLVSTVDLCALHQMAAEPHNRFESMVFWCEESGEWGGEDFDCRRYGDRAEALDGHESLVQQFSTDWRPFREPGSVVSERKAAVERMRRFAAEFRAKDVGP